MASRQPAVAGQAKAVKQLLISNSFFEIPGNTNLSPHLLRSATLLTARGAKRHFRAILEMKTVIYGTNMTPLSL